MRVLLVEDDPLIGQSLVRALKDNQCSVDWSRKAALARSAIDDGEYAVILLDLGLPDGEGVEVLKWLRKRGVDTPLLVLTARDEVDSRVSCLDEGADDYMLKPFHARELMARIRAVVRRKSGAATPTLVHGDVLLDINRRQLTFQGHSDVLRAREYALVLALMERPGSILSRAQLEERMYGWGEEVESNAVDVVIYGIRKRFGNAVIRNVRGLGWTIPGR